MEGIRGVIKGSKSGQGVDKKLHSEAHVLADELSTYFAERKRFGMYLGIIKRLGIARVRAIFADLKSDTRHVDNPRKMFMWLISRKSDKKVDDKPKP